MWYTYKVQSRIVQRFYLSLKDKGFMKSNKELLSLIMESEGFESQLDMLETFNTESVVPGICTECEAIESNCEPDATHNYCSECKSKKVQSVLILAGII